MITISLCMIVQNEESVIERCLTSVKELVDEIIIIDTGSTDLTKEIALIYTDKIYNFNWIDDFSAARNFAFSKATKDYQLWLDADDVILEEDMQKLLKLKEELSDDVDIVTMKYNTHFDENGLPIFTSTRERLFKREKDYKWNDPVHEYINLTGNIYYADDIYITHKKEHEYSDRNIKIYDRQIEQGQLLSPRSTYYYARELKDNCRYKEAIKYFNKFLNDRFGWTEDNIAACFNLGICYKAIGETEKALNAYLKSFEYATPRAENCCEIGYYYKELGEYEQAIFWFHLAINLTKPNTLGFLLNDYLDYIPNIELCVCYYHLNNVEKAIYHNNMAKQFKPNSDIVKNNDDFFNKIHKEELICVENVDIVDVTAQE